MDNILTVTQKGLTNEEKTAIQKNAKYESTIQLIRNLKTLNPTLRREIIDSIVKNIGRDSFLESLANYVDNK